RQPDRGPEQAGPRRRLPGTLLRPARWADPLAPGRRCGAVRRGARPGGHAVREAGHPADRRLPRLRRRLAPAGAARDLGRLRGSVEGAAMSTIWAAVLIVGAATIAIKSVGALVLYDRQLPPRLAGMIELLAPVMLAALVVTNTFGGDHKLVL